MKKITVALEIALLSVLIFTGCSDNEPITCGWDWDVTYTESLFQIKNESSSAINISLQSWGCYTRSEEDGTIETGTLFSNSKNHEYIIRPGETKNINWYHAAGLCPPAYQSFVLKSGSYTAVGCTESFAENTEAGKEVTTKFGTFNDFGYGWLDLNRVGFCSTLAVDENNDPIPNAVSHFVITFKEGEEKPTWEAVLRD